MNREKIFKAALAALCLGAGGLFYSLKTPAQTSGSTQAPAFPGFLSASVLILGMGAAALALGKKNRGTSGRTILILGSVPVAQNQRLVTVRFGKRVLLLGQTSSQITLLTETCDAEEIKQLEPSQSVTGIEENPASKNPWSRLWENKTGRFAFWAGLIAMGLIFSAGSAGAQQFPQALLNFEAAKSPQQAVGSLQILLLMSVLAFAPALILMVTSFSRILIVLSLLRQAIGLPQIPPNQIIVALSLFLTMFVMRPQLTAINDASLSPYLKGDITHAEAFKRAEKPLRSFMTAQTRTRDLQSFASMSGISNATEIPLTVLIPAFITSELKTAFQIGFLLFIPFLLVDMIVSSILMSMGMVMIPPAMISMPFKLLLFVLIDGWNLVLTGLAGSFR